MLDKELIEKARRLALIKSNDPHSDIILAALNSLVAEVDRQAQIIQVIKRVNQAISLVVEDKDL